MKPSRMIALGAILVQALLWLPAIGHAPVWGDEVFTITTSLSALPDLFAAAARDIHPPLYYLLQHFWLPLAPFDTVTAARLLSPLFALLTTWILFRYWLEQAERRFQICFLALWTVSPFLLLYARMARSYTLQMLLVVAAVTIGRALLRDSRSLRLWSIFTVLVIATAWVHYLPAAVLLFSIHLWVLLYRRDLFRRLAAVDAVFVICYLPWIAVAGGALRSWGAKTPYSVTGGIAGDHAVRVAYLGLAWVFGEVLSTWQIAVAALTSALLLWLWLSVLRHLPYRWFLLAAFAVAYLGAARWVAFSFVPARLIIFYPLFVWILATALARKRRVGTVVVSVVLLSSVVSAFEYFRGEDYLNKGYILPFAEVVDLAHRSSANPVFVMEAFDSDPAALAWAARGDRVEAIRQESDFAVLDQLDSQDIWYIRNTHDLSPAGSATAADDRLHRSGNVEDYYFLPYAAWERQIMTWLRWPGPPTHVLKVVHARPR